MNVNHTTAQNIKQTAKAQKVPMVFAKRSWASVGQKLMVAGLGLHE
ncbi:hypothetical protein [Propionispora sp. 2/2-37]|nr:hypothetical protein [Propionispora sp. 2/2-37]